MKESILYLNFFKKNCLLLFIPLVLFSAAGFYYQAVKPVMFSRTRVLEANVFENGLNEPLTSLNKRVLLIDQAVLTTRQPNVLASLTKNSDVALGLYKSAPLTVTATATSVNNLVLKEDLDSLSNYLTEKYKLKVVGIDNESSRRPDTLLGMLLGTAAGAFYGLVFSLLRSYFKYY